jgi:hypothetical protein
MGRLGLHLPLSQVHMQLDSVSVFGNGVWRICGHKRQKVTGGWKNYIMWSCSMHGETRIQNSCLKSRNLGRDRRIILKWISKK